jgi:nucleoside-diphosphate-sugar epimerase
MTQETSNVVVGAGPVGLAVAKSLIEKGLHVKLVRRSAGKSPLAGVELVAADMSHPLEVRRVLSDAKTVYFCAKPAYARWQEEFPPLVDALLAGLPSPATRVVYMDNLYGYGAVSGPLIETLPATAPGKKGKTRALLARRLLEAHTRGRARVAIGRASDFFGPHVREAAMGARVFQAALAGQGATALGNVDTLHSFAFIDDVAHGLVTLGQNDAAFGKAWHLPAAPPLTTRSFLELIYAEAQKPFRVRTVPRWLVNVLAVGLRDLREIEEVLYTFEHPLIVDHGQFEKHFGAVVTPHREAIRTTIDWYRSP